MVLPPAGSDPPPLSLYPTPLLLYKAVFIQPVLCGSLRNWCVPQVWIFPLVFLPGLLGSALLTLDGLGCPSGNRAQICGKRTEDLFTVRRFFQTMASQCEQDCSLTLAINSPVRFKDLCPPAPLGTQFFLKFPQGLFSPCLTCSLTVWESPNNLKTSSWCFGCWFYKLRQVYSLFFNY